MANPDAEYKADLLSYLIRQGYVADLHKGRRAQGDYFGGSIEKFDIQPPAVTRPLIDMDRLSPMFLAADLPLERQTVGRASQLWLGWRRVASGHRRQVYDEMLPAPGDRADADPEFNAFIAHPCDGRWPLGQGRRYKLVAGRVSNDEAVRAYSL